MAVRCPHPPTPMCNAPIVLTFRDPEKWWRYIETQGTVERSPVSCGRALLQADGPRTEYLAYCFDSVDMPTFDATCGVVKPVPVPSVPVQRASRDVYYSAHFVLAQVPGGQVPGFSDQVGMDACCEWTLRAKRFQLCKKVPALQKFGFQVPKMQKTRRRLCLWNPYRLCLWNPYR